MAKCICKMPEDLLKKLSRLGNKMDSITEEVLQVGGEVVLDKVKSNLEGVSTGELASSLGLSKVLVGKDGNANIKVGFAEPRKDGKSNAMIANIIEYGKAGQPAKPFLKPAKTSSKKPCIDAMTKKLEEEIKKA